MQTATRDGVGWKTNACTVTASFVIPKLVLRKPSIRMVYAGSIVRSRLHMHCYRRSERAPRRWSSPACENRGSCSSAMMAAAAVPPPSVGAAKAHP